MKVIFLDCDGVLNYDKWYISLSYSKKLNTEELDIDPEVVKRLNYLCKQTNSKIVVSSSWKIDSNWKNRLERAGLENIIDKTPDFIWLEIEDYCRGTEIESWLRNNQVEDYLILDDCQDFFESQLSHFIHINPYEGFTDEDLNASINYFKK